MNHVLDASAYLALIHGETGAERIEEILLSGQKVYMSTVNLAEVLAKHGERGDNLELVVQTMQNLGICFISLGEEDAVVTGKLRNVTRSAGLSLGDRACLALGLSYAVHGPVTVHTTDQAWLGLDLGQSNLEVRSPRSGERS